MKIKPIAMAAISGLVLALAGMPAMAEDASQTAQAMESSSPSTDMDSAQLTDTASSDNTKSSADSNTSATANNTGSSDEGNPDTPSGDDY